MIYLLLLRKDFKGHHSCLGQFSAFPLTVMGTVNFLGLSAGEWLTNHEGGSGGPFQRRRVSAASAALTGT